MAIDNLSRFDSNGIELVINTETGESFASVSGYARMANKDKSTISRRLQTVASESIKTAEIQTVRGLKTVALISEDLITQWIIKDNPAIATQLMKLGVRVFLHQLAGFQVNSSIQSTAKDKIDTINFTIDAIFSNVNIKSELIAGIKLNAFQSASPEIRQFLEPARQLLVENTASQSHYVTASEIGKQIQMSAQKVNKLLIDKGYQVKNETRKSQKDPFYIPTEKGLQYSTFTLSTGKGKDSSTYQQLRWNPKIIDFLS